MQKYIRKQEKETPVMNKLKTEEYVDYFKDSKLSSLFDLNTVKVSRLEMNYRSYVFIELRILGMVMIST